MRFRFRSDCSSRQTDRNPSQQVIAPLGPAATLPRGLGGQLGALSMVVNVIVLWSTIYMDAALNHLLAEGFDVRDEDVCQAFVSRFSTISTCWADTPSSCPIWLPAESSTAIAAMEMAWFLLHVPVPHGF